MRTCETSQRIKPSLPSSVPLSSLSIPTVCWESISKGCVFGLPEDSYDNTGIVLFVDRLSTMVHSSVVADSIDGEGTAQLIIHRIFHQHALPAATAYGRNFRCTSKFWRFIIQVLIGTRLNMLAPEHPQTNGQNDHIDLVIEAALCDI